MVGFLVLGAFEVGVRLARVALRSWTCDLELAEIGTSVVLREASVAKSKIR